MTVTEYLKQVEPVASGFDFPDVFAASLAISAKRQADALERIADALNSPDYCGRVGSAALAGAIVRGLQGRA